MLVLSLNQCCIWQISVTTCCSYGIDN